jgi:hypothetical protein
VVAIVPATTVELVVGLGVHFGVVAICEDDAVYMSLEK